MTQRILIPLLLLAAIVNLPAGAAAQPTAAMRAVDLQCELSKDPMGIDVGKPRLSWRVESSQQGQRQSAWQLLVGSSPDVLEQNRGDLWDSGRIATDQTTFVPYAGAQLASSRRVFWKVRAWDREGHESPWSEPATWTMGLLTPEEWKGVWIAAPAETESLLVRKEFTVKPGLRQALVHVSGMGQYELAVNGRRVGEDLLSPGWTDYKKTILYDTHDVTALLREGSNGKRRAHGLSVASNTRLVTVHKGPAAAKLVDTDID
jgi:hypothetical protein